MGSDQQNFEDHTHDMSSFSFRGINIRYLGRVAHLLKQQPPLIYLHVSRASCSLLNLDLSLLRTSSSRKFSREVPSMSFAITSNRCPFICSHSRSAIFSTVSSPSLRRRRPIICSMNYPLYHHHHRRRSRTAVRMPRTPLRPVQRMPPFKRRTTRRRIRSNSSSNANKTHS